MGKLQSVADRVFAAFMREDRRSLHEMRRAVLSEVGADGGGVTDHEIQIALSRNCMGELPWDYYPAYTRPPRYLSVRRVKELARRVHSGEATPAERQALAAQAADVERAREHWQAKVHVARAHVRDLSELLEVTRDSRPRGYTGRLAL